MTTSLKLRAAIASYPHIKALKAGEVTSERLAMAFEEVEPITRAFRRMVRSLDFDLSEMALATQAQAHEFEKPIRALPVVVMRGFHHGAMVCPVDSPLRGPEDLRGKRVGVRAFSQTTGVWVRGILLDEHGVDHRDMTWVTTEDAHVQEYRDAANVVRTRPGQDLSAMLMSGEIDAGISLAGLDPTKIRPVIPNAAAAAEAWHRKTGAYPVNHVLCVRTALLDANPWLAPELMRLLLAAKAAAPEPSAEARFGPIIGGDPLPYGLEANRIGIDYGLRYAAEQGLVRNLYRAEDIFVTL
jgi:4,5-dihydroxyphthalate decarboxylase